MSASASTSYGHQTARGLGEIIRRLILIYEGLTADEIAGRVEFI